MEPHEPPRRVRDWVGLLCRTNYEMRNGLGVIPKGALVEVYRAYQYRNLHIRTQPCETCGIVVVMNQVAAWKLTPVKRIAEPASPRRKR